MAQLHAVNARQGGKPQPARTEKALGRPKGLTSSKKRERDREIVRDRVVSDLSWGALALKYDLDERSCRRIVADYRTKNSESLSEIDPEGEVSGSLASLRSADRAHARHP